MKRTVAIILSIMLVLAIALPAAALTTVAVKSIKLSAGSISLKVGETADLTVAFTPSNTTQKALIYATANKNIAVVDGNGKITAVGKGTVKITVSTLNKNVTAPCNVTVTPAGYISDKPLKLSYLIQEHPSWPFNKDWKAWQGIQEATNIKFNFISATGDAFVQKMNMLFATNDLPDLIDYNLVTANKYGVLGQLANVQDYLDAMPNFRKILSEHSEAKAILTAGDGKMYFCPEVGLPKYSKVWLYRSDIFEKYNLQPPTNTDELYNVLKALKKMYPKSTPLTSRNAVANPASDWLVDLSYQWGTGEMMYYNQKNQKWQFGPIETNYRSMLRYLNKLGSEGLLDPEWSTQASKQWEDKMYADDQAFVTYDYIYRIDTMLATGRSKNPNYTLKALMPITTAGIGEKKYLIRSALVQTDGMMVSATSKYKKECFKFCDFLYSDAGAHLSNFGKVGDTAVIKPDGSWDYTKEVITPLNRNGTKNYLADYGFMSLGESLRITDDANFIVNLSNPNIQTAIKEMDTKNYESLPPPVLKFNDDEQKQVAELESAIRDYTLTHVVGFVQNGGFEKWNEYVSAIKALGVDKLVSLYNQMQARQK